jgi:UTP--glucose-1-phosphate uridylyltransferase
MTITKAIIPVAGWGTRRLPITKAIEKCMLPIGNRPIVDYVVQDCIAAGITDIYFVVSEQSTQLHDYYRRNEDLDDYLIRNGKEQLLPVVTPPEVKFHYIVQPSYGKYGTAVPVALATQSAGINEPVVVLMGDDVIYNRDGSSEVARLIEATAEGKSGMLGVEVEPSEVSKYGVLEVNDQQEFVRIIEKPDVDEAPSRFINVSKYILTPTILEAIKRYVGEEREGEYYITDPINETVALGEVMKVVPARGSYLDGGTVEGWLRANRIVLEDLK